MSVIERWDGDWGEARAGVCGEWVAEEGLGLWYVKLISVAGFVSLVVVGCGWMQLDGKRLV